MADIRTVDEVTVDDEYRVKIGEHDTGDGFEAAVIAVRRTKAAQAIVASLSVSDGDHAFVNVDDAPIMGAPHEYEAVGRAVDAYRQQQNSDDTDEDADGETVDDTH